MGAYASSAASGMNEVAEIDFAAKSRHVWMTGINVNRNQGTDVPPLAVVNHATESVGSFIFHLLVFFFAILLLRFCGEFNFGVDCGEWKVNVDRRKINHCVEPLQDFLLKH